MWRTSRWRRAILFSAFAFLPRAGHAADGDAFVLENKLCAKVVMRDCAQELRVSSGTLDADVTQVAWWLRLSVTDADEPIRVRWYTDGKQTSEVELSLQESDSFRTWASKSVRSGDWKVEALTSSGAVLATASFIVPARGKPK